MSKGTTYVVTGYPGCGKSFVSEILAEKTGGIYMETGDIVREGASEYFGKPISEIPSHKLGEYSTMRRERDGGDYVVQDVLERLSENDSFPQKPAILSGLRDTEAIPIVEQEFETHEIIWVAASFETRLNRLQERARQDEDGYDEQELRKRDEREKEWGTEDMSAERTATVNNDITYDDEETARQEILKQLNGIV